MFPHYLIFVVVLQVKEGMVLRKTIMSLGEIKGVFHINIFHNYGDKSQIRPLFNVRNIQVPNGKMAWIPKCNSTNPKENTSVTTRIIYI